MLESSKLGLWIRSLIPESATDPLPSGKYIHTVLLEFLPPLPDHLQSATRFSGHVSRRWSSNVGLLFGHFTSSFGIEIDSSLVESHLLRSIQSISGHREARVSFVDDFCELVLFLVHLYNEKAPTTASGAFFHPIPSSLSDTVQRLHRLFSIPKKTQSGADILVESVTSSLGRALSSPAALPASSRTTLTSSSSSPPGHRLSPASSLSRLFQHERQTVTVLRSQVEDLQLQLEEQQQSHLNSVNELLQDQRKHFDRERTERDRLVRRIQFFEQSRERNQSAVGSGSAADRDRDISENVEKLIQEEKLRNEKVKDGFMRRIVRILKQQREMDNKEKEFSLESVSGSSLEDRRRIPIPLGILDASGLGDQLDSFQEEVEDEGEETRGSSSFIQSRIDEESVVDSLREYVMNVRQEATRLRAEVRQAENEKEGLRRKLRRAQEQLDNLERQNAAVAKESSALADALRNAMQTIKKASQEASASERRHQRELLELRETLEKRLSAARAQPQAADLQDMIRASQKPILDLLRRVRSQKLRTLRQDVDGARESLKGIRQAAFMLRQAFREDYCMLSENIRLFVEQWAGWKRVSEDSSSRLNEHVYARQLSDQNLQVEEEKVRHLESQALVLQDENSRLKKLVKKYIRKTSATLQMDNEKLQKELQERVAALLDSADDSGVESAGGVRPRRKSLDFDELQDLLQMVSSRDQGSGGAQTGGLGGYDDVFGVDSPVPPEDVETLQQYMKQVGSLDSLKTTSPPRRPLL